MQCTYLHTNILIYMSLVCVMAEGKQWKSSKISNSHSNNFQFYCLHLTLKCRIQKRGVCVRVHMCVVACIFLQLQSFFSYIIFMQICIFSAQFCWLAFLYCYFSLYRCILPGAQHDMASENFIVLSVRV